MQTLTRKSLTSSQVDHRSKLPTSHSRQCCTVGTHRSKYDREILVMPLHTTATHHLTCYCTQTLVQIMNPNQDTVYRFFPQGYPPQKAKLERNKPEWANLFEEMEKLREDTTRSKHGSGHNQLALTVVKTKKDKEHAQFIQVEPDKLAPGQWVDVEIDDEKAAEKLQDLSKNNRKKNPEAQEGGRQVWQRQSIGLQQLIVESLHI